MRKAFSFMNSYYEMISDQPYDVQCDFLYNITRYQLGAVEPDFKTDAARLLWRGHHYTIEKSLNQYMIKSGKPCPSWADGFSTVPSTPPSTPLSTPHSTPQVQEQEEEQEQEQEQYVFRSFNHLSITEVKYQKLVSDFEGYDVDGVLDAIENFKGNIKYKDLYLTARNWLKKEKPTKSKRTVPNY